MDNAKYDQSRIYRILIPTVDNGSVIHVDLSDLQICVYLNYQRILYYMRNILTLTANYSKISFQLRYCERIEQLALISFNLI